MHLEICWDVLMGFALSVVMFLTMRTKIVLSSDLKAKVVLSSLKLRYQGLHFEAKFANLLAVLGCPSSWVGAPPGVAGGSEVGLGSCDFF